MNEQGDTQDVSAQPVQKKLLIIGVLRTLQLHSDEEHPLRNTEIIQRLRDDWNLETTRKSIRQNITALVTAGYPIEYSQGWFYRHELTHRDLDILQDAVLRSFADEKESCKIIEKLRLFASDQYVPRPVEWPNRPYNDQFFHNINILQKAIYEGRKVRFVFCDFDSDKELHPRMKGTRVLHYTLSPINIRKHGSVIMLEGTKDGEEKHLTLQIVRMRDVEELEEKADVNRVSEAQINYIRIKRSGLSDVFEFFGTDVDIIAEKTRTVDVQISGEKNIIRQWVSIHRDIARMIAEPVDVE